MKKIILPLALVVGLFSCNNKTENGRFTLAGELKNAPKIFTETGMINWGKPVHEIYNLIRGLSPYPGAFTRLRDKTLKIFKADPINGLHSSIVAGNFETDRKTFMRFACSNGYINILELQLEGKKKMKIGEFLRGYHFDI